MARTLLAVLGSHLSGLTSDGIILYALTRSEKSVPTQHMRFW